MEDWTSGAEHQLVSLEEDDYLKKYLTKIFYDEILLSLSPAPGLIRGRDDEVRHVRVVVQMIHPLPH